LLLANTLLAWIHQIEKSLLAALALIDLEVWLWTFWFRTVWLVNTSAGQPQFLNANQKKKFLY
jgi:hypothetical protein